MKQILSSVIAICIAAFANCVAGCTCDRSAEDAGGAAPPSSASAAASSSAAPVAIPIDPEQVRRAVNPLGEKAYSGPVGSVRGSVTVSGDQAPELETASRKSAQRCPASARQLYGTLFREGPNRRLADVLVTVTGYRGFVPAQSEVVRVEVRDCSYGTRTIAMTFGQRIEVLNTGRQAYVPHLAGGSMKAMMVALPRGDSVKLYPTKPGRYLLTDQMHPLMSTEVLVVKYPTVDVTGLDGEFEIGGIPVGEVTVTAFLPATMSKVERKVTVRDGQTTEVDFTIDYQRPPPAASESKPPAPPEPLVH